MRTSRRSLLLGGLSAGLGASACESGTAPVTAAAKPALGAAQAHPLLDVSRLGSPPWKTFDPFLFCVHHRDHYPAGNAELGPLAPLAGRNIGNDFGGKDGWSMYHGDVVPGFPRHPHRGFETVTITRRGFVDHSDSLGATARYGDGDVQWMTAGSGIVHAEMFPLIRTEGENPAELFQIWLNLPSRRKFARPHFSMFWKRDIPEREHVDEAGRTTRVTVIAGAYEQTKAPPPPPDSWASEASSELAIWTLAMAAGARFELPAAAPTTQRCLYFFAGESIEVAGKPAPSGTALRLGPSRVRLTNGPAAAELLLLQGRPIGEPVVAHGPFVMNQRSEIEQAVRDYQRTQFGGWPWRSSGPVHAREAGRFAVHADGRRERGV